MTFKFFPHTDEEEFSMLHKIGAKYREDLFVDIPESIQFKNDYDLPWSMSEIEIRQFFNKLGKKNEQLTVFVGAGVYDHYTPAIIPSLIERSEFLTSYTPYQAEISQGTLHYIFEYQSMMAELTGMDVSNASMYDGTTATAEAVLMVVAAGKKCDKVLVSSTIDPKILKVIHTYAHFHGVNIEMIDAKDGVTDKEDLNSKISAGGVAGVVIQQPNYYGIVEDYSGYADTCHDNKALLIMNCIPADLAILKSPGQWGADIAVGDCQSLGIPMNFGGPYAGYMCCTEKLTRKMPGRIVGMTKDNRGQRAFVLTLQAREQHIRRQKATSNICSNESLITLSATIYMALLGKIGLYQAAELSYGGAHYLYKGLLDTGHFTKVFDAPFFNEFCVKYDGDVDKLQQMLIKNGILGGIKIDETTLMFAVTEKRTKDEIDMLINLVKEGVR